MLCCAKDTSYRHTHPCRTVRAYAGESQERERFACQVAAALASGLRLGQARAMLEVVNRGAVHASLLCLYAFGGEQVRGVYCVLWFRRWSEDEWAAEGGDRRASCANAGLAVGTDDKA